MPNKPPMKMGHSPAEMSPYKMGHSPAEMGHSPMENQNKGYAKQERKDLMQDMPVVKDAMGGRSWMSKHSRSAMMMKGPMEMGHSPAEMGHKGSPAKHELKDPTKGTHWHAEDGTIVTEKEGRKGKKKLPTGPNVPGKKGGPQMGHSPAEKHCM